MPTSRLCSCAHSTPCSRLRGGVLHIISYHAFSFLAGTFLFTMNVRANYGPPYLTSKLHQGPAKARRGRQRRAGRPRSTEFLPLLNAYLLLSKARLVVTNPAVRHGTVLLQVGLLSLFHALYFFASPCLFHWAWCIVRCKLAAFAEAQCLRLKHDFALCFHLSPSADGMLLQTCSST